MGCGVSIADGLCSKQSAVAEFTSLTGHSPATAKDADGCPGCGITHIPGHCPHRRTLSPQTVSDRPLSVTSSGTRLGALPVHMRNQSDIAHSSTFEGPLSFVGSVDSRVLHGGGTGGTAAGTVSLSNPSVGYGDPGTPPQHGETSRTTVDTVKPNQRSNEDCSFEQELASLTKPTPPSHRQHSQTSSTHPSPQHPPLSDTNMQLPSQPLSSAPPCSPSLAISPPTREAEEQPTCELASESASSPQASPKQGAAGVPREELLRHAASASPYVSMGGSLYLPPSAQKQIVVTKTGLVSPSGSHQVDINQDDLEFLGSLGRGAGGTVKAARHRGTKQLVAVKTIATFSASRLGEIEKELMMLHGCLDKRSSVSSFIVDFYGAFVKDGYVNIVMELMDGSLGDIIKTNRDIPEEILACFMKPVLCGLDYLHHKMRLVHRDIKPQNVLFKKDGSVKISDFGISSRLDTNTTHTSSFVGTVTYMSPERLDGESYSFSADIWSLGILLLEMAKGKHPYGIVFGEQNQAKFWRIMAMVRTEGSLQLVGDHFSEGLKDFVNQCLIRDKDQRPSAERLLEHDWVMSNTLPEESLDKDRLQQWLMDPAVVEGGGGDAAGGPSSSSQPSTTQGVDSQQQPSAVGLPNVAAQATAAVAEDPFQNESQLHNALDNVLSTF